MQSNIHETRTKIRSETHCKTRSRILSKITVHYGIKQGIKLANKVMKRYGVVTMSQSLTTFRLDANQ